MNIAIVFGNDHTNSVGVIQSLGKAGYRSIGLVYGFKNDFVKSSNYVDYVISAKNAQECIEKLINTDLGYRKRLPIIATCDMAALTLERNSDRLKERFLFEYSTNFSLEYIAKKENQVRMAMEAGFNVPKSWNLSNTKQIPNDVIYPCLIKPLVSCEGAKSDIRVCNTQKELEFNLSSLGHTKNVLLQQYIDRDYEISILGCGLSSGNCVIPAIENKLTLYPKYVGLECLANMQPLEDGLIKRSIEKLVSLAGYVGLFSVEMMHCKKDDKFYFTEINLRNDGAESFVTKYGANLPLNHVEDLMGIPLTKQKEFHPGFYIWEMHHLSSLMCRDISILTWLKDICKSNGFLMSHTGDMKPFFCQFINPILRKLKIKKSENYK
jgi:D-aspartate ligase